MSAAPSEPPTQPTLAAALAAWDAGLCVVRVNADGTKTPIGRWKQWQTNRPPRDTVARWFTDGGWQGAIRVELLAIRTPIVPDERARRYRAGKVAA